MPDFNELRLLFHTKMNFYLRILQDFQHFCDKKNFLHFVSFYVHGCQPSHKNMNIKLRNQAGFHNVPLVKSFIYYLKTLLIVKWI